MKTKNIGILGRISGQIIRSRVERYIDDPDTRQECDPDAHCAVLGGSSNFIIPDKNRPGVRLTELIYPLDVVLENSEMGFRTVKGEEKYLQTLYISAVGLNKVEGVQFEIKAYNAPEGQPQPPQPCYVIEISGGKLMTNLSSHANGIGHGEIWDYNKEGLAPMDGPFSIGIPYVFADPGHKTSPNEIYDQLLIENYREFEEFLLNPDGKTFMAKASGKRYLKDDNMEHERSIEVSLTFSVPVGGINLFPDFDY
jgi:hypothetical protein